MRQSPGLRLGDWTGRFRGLGLAGFLGGSAQAALQNEPFCLPFHSSGLPENSGHLSCWSLNVAMAHLRCTAACSVPPPYF